MNVESIKTELVKIIGNVTYVHAIIENVSDKLRKSELEIENLNDIIDELRDEKANMQSGFDGIVKRSGLDMSPCKSCGEMIICIPDGMPMCQMCAAKGGEA